MTNLPPAKNAKSRSDQRFAIFRLFSKLFTPPTKHWLGAVVITGLVLFLFIATNNTSADIFFIVFLFAVFFWNIDGRVSITGALFFLILIPIMLGLGRAGILSFGEDWAEVVAVWVFYFLAIGVLKQIWELRHETSSENSPAVKTEIKKTTSGDLYLPKRVTKSTDVPLSKVTSLPTKPKKIHDIVRPRAKAIKKV